MTVGGAGLLSHNGPSERERILIISIFHSTSSGFKQNNHDQSIEPETRGAVLRVTVLLHLHPGRKDLKSSCPGTSQISGIATAITTTTTTRDERRQSPLLQSAWIRLTLGQKSREPKKPLSAPFPRLHVTEVHVCVNHSGHSLHSRL